MICRLCEAMTAIGGGCIHRATYICLGSRERISANFKTGARRGVGGGGAGADRAAVSADRAGNSPGIPWSYLLPPATRGTSGGRPERGGPPQFQVRAVRHVEVPHHAGGGGARARRGDRRRGRSAHHAGGPLAAQAAP